MHSSSSPSRYYIPCADEDVATKTHCNCKIPLPLKIQVSWTQTNLGRRFKECLVRKCRFHGFIDDELPSQYYKELLFHQYDEFLAPSSDDELLATFNDEELQYNNVGEMKVSKMLIGMIEEELNSKFCPRGLKSASGIPVEKPWDFTTRRVLLRCDSTGDLYPVTSPSSIPQAYLVSQHTWHQHLGHPGSEVGTDTAYLLLYVDDIVLTASSESLVVFISEKYAIEILDKAHMDNCNPSRTPIVIESKLGSDGDSISDLTLYWSLAGSLQYLTFTRPNISYAFQYVCLYMHDPREPYFLILSGFRDWAGFPTTRRLTSGYCVFLGNNLLVLFSKRQPTLSRSSAEAE
uniref:Ribonuclease H-like domain-containing protein n=1 Tax=Tanacetum cinerariifolium TaxID=118510 RepID=A0A6L2JZV5_TANCI|nr:ribonuclease H-like domain-containing protein [Tanacetum cinerariifolium]